MSDLHSETRGHRLRGWPLLARRSQVACLFIFACQPQERSAPPPADASPEQLAIAGAVVAIGAGDIAICGANGDEATAAIVDSILVADSVAKVDNVVITMGDNAYPSGSRGGYSIFARCFTPSWGDRRIMKMIRPSPGNHDFQNQGGPGYYAYFGDRAGPSGKGYYSYDIGDWHAVSLNSEILDDQSRLHEAAAQEDWLREDLKDHSKKCTLAYFHQPLFSSGDFHGDAPAVAGLWNILYEGGVDLVVNGHEHHYERFVPQTPLGVADSVNGIEEIIVGTGGAALRGVRYPPEANSAARIHGYFGVLKLTLGADEYRHAFLDTEGRVWDKGGRKCHDPPVVPGTASDKRITAASRQRRSESAASEALRHSTRIDASEAAG